MLISYKRPHFVFVHIYKNAGTSIRTALLPHVHTASQRRCYKIFKRCGIRVYDPSPIDYHSSACDIVNYLGMETFLKHYSFAVVRNPWDWQASLYSYMLKRSDHPQHNIVRSLSGFDEYIDWRCQYDFQSQKDFIFSKAGDLLVTSIMRYENLADDWDKFESLWA